MDKHIINSLSQYCTVAQKQSLAKMTTLRIGGEADIVLYPENEISLEPIFAVLKENNIPYKVIGKGSDLLCSDKPFHGAIIRLDKNFTNMYFDEELVTVQAGASIIALSIEAMKKGLSGLEFCSGIPGTVGGAIFMNAGAYKSSMEHIIDSVFVYHDGIFQWLSNEDCKFGYRTSIFQQHTDWLILGAKIKLVKQDYKLIEKLMEDRRERRMASQPLDYPSCGSVFRNPEKGNAWEYIDGIGYRGKKHGGALVSEKHCNFILNYDGASAKEYMELVNEIKEKVKEKYDIELHTEMELFNWD